MSGAFDTPQAVESAFYEAFARVDLTAMETVWLDGEGACCLHPGGGLLRGKTRIMQSWAEILVGVAPPRIGFRLLARTAASDLCVHLVEESIQAGGDPAAPVVRVIVSNVYVRDGSGWHLATHHASLPLIERSGPQGRQLH